tara:strand:- start:1499 stop:1906 length:408 start_codon:yes stop_codon:yes gene_type:complete
MSKQQETWKESLARVRGELVESKNETVEETVEETQTEEDSLIEEIGQLLNDMDDAEKSESSEVTVESLQARRLELQEELAQIDQQINELIEEPVEKSVEKLAEKNMLGRLAKSLRLNQTGKQKLFDYFEKGELQQ